MKTLNVILVLLLFTSTIHAKTIHEEHLKTIMSEAMDLHFKNDPSFYGANVTLRGSLSKSDYFFQTNINYSYFFGTTPHYFIEYNPMILKDAPSNLALRAILTHELFHVKDMIERSRVGNFRFGIKYVIKDRIKYERFTDERTLDQGEAPGLIEYREWIYSKLTPKQITVKKKIYYTPDEIIARNPYPEN